MKIETARELIWGNLLTRFYSVTKTNPPEEAATLFLVMTSQKLTRKQVKKDLGRK